MSTQNQAGSESVSGNYIRRLSGLSYTSSLESNRSEAEAKLTGAEITEITQRSKSELYRIIDGYLGKKSELYYLADQLLTSGADALKAVANRDDKYLSENMQLRNMLEVIVKTDGSRPSFLVTHGKVDKASSPVGNWGGLIDAFSDEFSYALSAVGRINLKEQHLGTGFTVHPDFIITNRHVLQAIAIKNQDGSWTMSPDANINFGYEFRTPAAQPRYLKQVVFCGAKDIDGRNIDHAKLDLALLQLQPAPASEKPRQVFAVSVAQEGARENKDIIVMGYPGDPGIDGIILYKNLLEELFESTFGYKRLAPGKVMKETEDFAAITMAHDTTTLGGNSGSVIVLAGSPLVAVGLHYGGTPEVPRINWGHIFANAMTATNGSSKTLREHLDAIGVSISGRSLN